MSDGEDFRALLQGEITSEEYVRRLNERVARQREEQGYADPCGGKFYPLLRRPRKRSLWTRLLRR